MQKWNQSYQDSSVGIIKRLRLNYEIFISQLAKKTAKFLLAEGYLLVIIAFLLGKAVVMDKFAPFSLAFFAAALLEKRKHAMKIMLALVIGASANHWQESVVVCIAIILFMLLNKIYDVIGGRKLGLISLFIVLGQVGARTFQLYFQNGLGTYTVTMYLTEAILSSVLFFIFCQCISLLAENKKINNLKTEEVISLVIMIASILTGMIGWKLYDVSLGNVFSRYLVLFFAGVCGAAIGTTVGVVTGLVFSLSNLSSLYQITLLAFSGLLGGLLKDGKKIGVSFGLVVGTLLIGLYSDGKDNLLISIYESALAIMLFFLTPKVFYKRLAKVIPGTDEHYLEQQLYVRKVRDVTANRVNQFSDVFQAISNSFLHKTAENKSANTQELDLFFSKVTESSCQNCFKKTKCWGGDFQKTYEHMTRLQEALQHDPAYIPAALQTDWKRFCVKFDLVTDSMKAELIEYVANQKLKQQIDESRKIVAEQLRGVSKVMEEFAEEIQKERQHLQAQEEQILAMIETVGVEVEKLDIFTLEERNMELDVVVGSADSIAVGEKIIAPMLSEILGEYIQLQEELSVQNPMGSTRLRFGSVKRYIIDVGVAFAAKGGGLISGDSYSIINIGKGKQALAISDGMGNGNRAHEESEETLSLLKKILTSGIEEKVAIRSINSILALRTTDEIFSTLDLAMLDLQTGGVKFLKIGSTPSFIRRDMQVKKIQGNNLPMGIVREFDIDVVHEQLQADDLLIMMSDGVFEGPKSVENYELWMQRKIRELKTNSPQAVADLILEEVIRSNSGSINDDMTVLVMLLRKNEPKWANIKPGKVEKEYAFAK